MEDPTTTPAASITLLTNFTDPLYSRGPLTTLYSPPASCVDVLTRSLEYDWMYFGNGASNYFDPACYPTGIHREQNFVDTTYWSQYYYSPGLCPYGWTTVTTYQLSYPGLIPTEYLSLGPDTSAALCCPLGYVHSAYGHLCSSTITSDQVISYIYPTNIGISWIASPISTTTFASATSVVGNGIPIWWQKSDEAMLASAASASLTMVSSTISSSLTSSSTMSSTGSGEPTPSDPSQTKGAGGLSTGAHIGIGVGAGLGALVIVALGLVIFCRGRRSTQPHVQRDGPIQELYAKQMIHEMYAANASEIYTPTETHYNRHELSGKDRFESSHGNAHGTGLTSR